MYYGSANRDRGAFDEPERSTSAARPTTMSPSAAAAPHFCLGAQIARVEIDAMFREVLTRMPDLRLAGETEWLPSTFISGPKHIRVRP